jgi:biotin synthase
MNWNAYAEQVLRGEAIGRKEALSILASSDEELLDVAQAAFRIRTHFFGRGVSLHVIQNAKCGLCSENCAFCSQSAVSTSEIRKYPLQSVHELMQGAREARQLNAIRYCIVTSSRGPTDAEVDTVCEAVRSIKKEMDIQICTSLGLLNSETAERLKQAGVDRYNHNLETSSRFFPAICQTHSYQDRVATASRAKAAGLELCCGGLLGMGETLEDRVDLAFALHEIQADSIPVNFLDPRSGTPLEKRGRMSPADCIRALAMFRLVNPSCEIRIAGGREACLRSLQPLSLFIANSMFTQGYLTTGGQGYQADLDMLHDTGFTISHFES